MSPALSKSPPVTSKPIEFHDRRAPFTGMNNLSPFLIVTNLSLEYPEINRPSYLERGAANKSGRKKHLKKLTVRETCFRPNLPNTKSKKNNSKWSEGNPINDQAPKSTPIKLLMPA